MAQRCSESALPASARHWRPLGDHRPALLYGNHRRGERSLNRLRHSAAEQFMLIHLVVDAVEIRTSNDLASVEERDAFALCDIAITLTQENRLFLAALEHFRIVGELGDRGWRDQEDFRRATVPVLPIDAGDKDEAPRAFRDVESGNGKPLLHVDAAKRED